MRMVTMLLLFAACASTADADDFTISAAASLAGCWQGRENSGLQEQWMEPAGGMMLGIGRTVKDGKTTQYEFLRIVEEQGSVSYIAKPSGQQEASFKLTESNEKQLVFENPDHDFPQRIIYTFASDDLVTARIEGKNDGKALGIDFLLKRVECPGTGK